MFESLLLPAVPGLKLNQVWADEQVIDLVMTTTQPSATCPLCAQPSTRIHSRYDRTITDLPWAGIPVRVSIQVRRFFCKTANCCRKIFTERLTPIVAAYARRTSRLNHQLQALGFALGGECGAPTPEYPTPRVLGVDEWAKRKGQSYGTILVALEPHSPVDLLPEATAAAFAQWLRQHPGVEIIRRDRGANYKDGATQGAPEAIQVADRFHLLVNLSDALKRMLERHGKELREVSKQAASIATSPAQDKTPSESVADEQAAVPASITQRPLSQEEIRYMEIKTLQGEGWSQRAAHLNLHRRTVHRYMAADEFLHRAHGRQSVSTVAPFMGHVSKRLAEGCRSCSQLWQELQGQGYKGSYSSVWRALSQVPHRAIEPSSQPKVASVARLSARQAARLLVTRPEDRTSEEEIPRKVLCEVGGAAQAAYPLAQDFGQMVREQRAEGLDSWLKNAEGSSVAELQRFATSLRSDYEEVKAALTLPWSNGQTEGQIHRLKLIKRQMYGRANFDLLRSRVLHRI